MDERVLIVGMALVTMRLSTSSAQPRASQDSSGLVGIHSLRTFQDPREPGPCPLMSEFPTVPPWGLKMVPSLLNGLNTPVKEAGVIMAEAEAPSRPAQPTVPRTTLKMTRRGDAPWTAKSASLQPETAANLSTAASTLGPQPYHQATPRAPRLPLLSRAPSLATKEAPAPQHSQVPWAPRPAQLPATTRARPPPTPRPWPASSQGAQPRPARAPQRAACWGRWQWQQR